MRQAAQLTELVIGQRGQFGDAVPGEDIWRRASRRRLPRRSLRGILTELGDMTIAVWIGPGAGLTVVAVLLVDRRERPERASNAHLAKGVAKARQHAANSRRG